MRKKRFNSAGRYPILPENSNAVMGIRGFKLTHFVDISMSVLNRVQIDAGRMEA